MNYVPIVFAVSLVVVSFILVIVGIYSLMVLSEFHRTLQKVNSTLTTNPEKLEHIKTTIAQATESIEEEQQKKGKKRSYIRKSDPKQFRGL